jgi:predicted SnoaL-like aldol condensation-catalyzing enzyme
MNPTNNHLTRKQCAISFLTLASSGNVRSAYAQHVAQDFFHHNPYYRSDANSLMQGMEKYPARFPGKVLEILRALEDGNLVAVHSRVKLNPEGHCIALVHIFRFRGNSIVELGDLGQPVPEDMPNELGML